MVERQTTPFDSSANTNHDIKILTMISDETVIFSYFSFKFKYAGCIDGGMSVGFVEEGSCVTTNRILFCEKDDSGLNV